MRQFNGFVQRVSLLFVHNCVLRRIRARAYLFLAGLSSSHRTQRLADVKGMELCSAATLAIEVPPPRVTHKVAGTSTQILVLIVEDDVDAAALLQILLTEDGDHSFR